MTIDLTRLVAQGDGYIDVGTSARGVQLATAGVLLLLFAFVVWGVVDAIRRPQRAWVDIGRTQIVWVIIQVVLGPVGTLMYLIAPRRELMRATAGAHHQ